MTWRITLADRSRYRRVLHVLDCDDFPGEKLLDQNGDMWNMTRSDPRERTARYTAETKTVPTIVHISASSQTLAVLR